ncbi:hypothetical protein ASD01_25090 [Ensifer sp. Root423]|nr:hypothetical protein ASD01_25090 [Ensifer sp. Root423]KQX54771.1 hypothetical protein ASD49_27785 [Ensifer sp. Root1298]KQX89146.1 hypothetical protein ASD41_26470 [Ensifer sp. Root1312]KRC24956.1 hypothetical protein ASE29_25285 [Ensifer sp. Root74]
MGLGRGRSWKQSLIRESEQDHDLCLQVGADLLIFGDQLDASRVLLQKIVESRGGERVSLEEIEQIRVFRKAQLGAMAG